MQIATKATTAPNVKGCETHNNNRDDNREKRWLMIHINDNIGCTVQVFSQAERLKGKILFPTVMEMNSSQMSQPLLVFWTYAKWKPDLLPATVDNNENYTFMIFI